MIRTDKLNVFIRNFVPGLTAAAFIAAMVGGIPLAAQGQQCDCSCENYQELITARDEYQAKAQAGAVAPPPPAIMQMVTCSATCAQQWTNCPEPGEEQVEALSKDLLTPRYLQGTWCGIYGGQEPTEYRFNADGSYQIGIPAGGGFALQPGVQDLEHFRNRIGVLLEFEADTFTSQGEHGRKFEFERRACG